MERNFSQFHTGLNIFSPVSISLQLHCSRSDMGVTQPHSPRLINPKLFFQRNVLIWGGVAGGGWGLLGLLYTPRKRDIFWEKLNISFGFCDTPQGLKSDTGSLVPQHLHYF